MVFSCIVQGDNAVVIYQLLDETDVFTLANNRSGIVTVQNSTLLDRERTDTFLLRVS